MKDPAYEHEYESFTGGEIIQFLAHVRRHILLHEDEKNIAWGIVYKATTEVLWDMTKEELIDCCYAWIY